MATGHANFFLYFWPLVWLRFFWKLTKYYFMATGHDFEKKIEKIGTLIFKKSHAKLCHANKSETYKLIIITWHSRRWLVARKTSSHPQPADDARLPPTHRQPTGSAHLRLNVPHHLPRPHLLSVPRPCTARTPPVVRQPYLRGGGGRGVARRGADGRYCSGPPFSPRCPAWTAWRQLVRSWHRTAATEQRLEEAGRERAVRRAGAVARGVG